MTIIGGGPVGLFAAGAAGELGAVCQVIESRFDLGGMMLAIYPDKDVYNFPGVQVIKGRDLVSDLIHKATTLGMATRLGEYVTELTKGSKDTVIVKTNKSEYLSSTVLIASGLKAYLSPLSDSVQIENWNGYGIFENWPKPEAIKGRKVAVIPGTHIDIEYFENIDTANSDFIWLTGEATEAVEKTVKSLETKGEIICKPWKIKQIIGHKTPQYLILQNKESGEERSIDIDAVISLVEPQPRQTVFSNFGIETVGGQIKVDSRMQTSFKRIYAVGDIAYYPGKIKLLSTGIYEARIAVKNALKII